MIAARRIARTASVAFATVVGLSCGQGEVEPAEALASRETRSEAVVPAARPELAGLGGRTTEPQAHAPERDLRPVIADAGREPAQREPVPEGHVAVFVVDHEGRPVEGVRVRGVELDAEGDLARRPYFGFGGVTDLDGRAAVPERHSGTAHAAELFGGALAFSTPGDPRRIVLPPLGSLVLDLRGFPDATALRIDADWSGARRHRERDPGGAVLRYDLVPVGATFGVCALADERVLNERVAGPTEHGEVLRWRAVPPRFLDVVARIAGDDGAPLAGVEVDLVARDGDEILLEPDPREPGLVRASLTSDEWPFRAGAPVVACERCSDHRDARVRVTSFEAPPLPEVGDLDLGEIRLRALPFVTSGRVVDAGGRPVPAATVSLQRGRFEVGTFRGGLRPFDPDEPAPDPIEVALERTSGPAAFSSADTTDADGRFELRATRAPDAELFDGLFVVARDELVGTRASVPVEPGRRGLEIVLRSDGRVRIDLSRIPAAQRSGLDFEFVRSDGWRAEQRRGGDPGGEWVTDDLPPGTYSLHVMLMGTALDRIDGIVVPAGGTCGDPRLQPLQVNSRRLTFERPDGTTVDRLEVLHRAERSRTPMWWTYESEAPGGPIQVLQGSETRAVFARAPGFAPVEITDLADGAVVVLDPLRTLRLEFSGDVDAVRSGLYEIVHVAPGVAMDLHMTRLTVQGEAGSCFADVEVVDGAEYELRDPVSWPFDVSRGDATPPPGFFTGVAPDEAQPTREGATPTAHRFRVPPGAEVVRVHLE